MSDKEHIYRLVFLNRDEVYEIYARQIFQSDLFGFLEVEEFIFGERSSLVIDPGEDKLKQELNEAIFLITPLYGLMRWNGKVWLKSVSGNQRVRLLISRADLRLYLPDKADPWSEASVQSCRGSDIISDRTGHIFQAKITGK